MNPIRQEYADTIAGFRIELPEELPITRHADEIMAAWRDHQVVVIGGDTGSGKTTQLPKLALKLGRGLAGRIGCTQPRRLAAAAMARRVAAELGVEPGQGVGYQVRFENRTVSSTVLKFMTDGILLAETSGDRLLRQYDTLIIDEVHERSLNIDFLLGYLKRLLPRRPDLKVALSSATLDTEAFSKFFGDAPVVAIEGRTYPVEDMFMPPDDPDAELTDEVARAVDFVTGLDPRGDALIFLPGEREIRDATDRLNGRNYRNTEVLPLFGRLSGADQQKVFSPGRARRLVLATNVAETSVTIPRIHFVIDSGLARVKRYNPRTRIEELQIEFISQASARQRRGRCGRVADGVCVKLYSEDDLARSAPYTDPEIRRSNLAGVILQMAALNLPPVNEFPFLNPPPSAAVREGVKTLEELCAITPAGRLTPEGRKLATLPIDPHIGKMLLEAARLRVLPETMVTAAYLSIQDPAERPLEKQARADEAHRRFRHEKSDFLSIVNLWNALAGQCTSNRLLREFCRNNFYNFNRIREWRNLAGDLAESMRDCGVSRQETPGKIDEVAYQQFHCAILAGIPRNIAKFLPEDKLYLGPGGRKASIFPGSGLFKKKPTPQWIMSFALVETRCLYSRTNAEIEPEYLEMAAPHLCAHVCDQAHWDENSGFVYARERLTFGGLLIHAGRRVLYAKRNPAEARSIFIREGLATGLVKVPGSWVDRHNQTLAELESLEEKLRRPGTVIDREAIVDYYMELLPEPVDSTTALKELCRRDKQDYSISAADASQEQYGTVDPADYPDVLESGGLPLELEYRFDPGEDDDGITMRVPAEQLNLVPEWAADYLVPGYLAEKVEKLLRALPKSLRQAVNPIGKTAAEFAERVEARQLFSERPIVQTLAEFVSDETGENVAPSVFDDVELPEYLIMKIAVIAANGKIREILREIPSHGATGSRLSRALPAASGFAAAGCTVWPGVKPLPETVELPDSGGRRAFVALCDEGEAVGEALYLSEAEAHYRHRRGVLRLFRLEYGDQMKFIRRSIRFPREVELTLFMRYREFADDIVDAAALSALGEELWDIRDAGEFSRRAEQARSELGVVASALEKKTVALAESVSAIDALLRRVKNSEGGADAKSERELLCRPGFLRGAYVFSDYSRYLRGLKLRLERMISDPSRDVSKLETISDYVERFRIAAETVEDLASHPELEEFFALLEEARLAVFAPEVTTTVRNPVKLLATEWEKLRI
ncbi:MAG: ATP-dependent RNA helicase HrpA [Victivallaceae bacterium]|nr:ATP-dependent RNA helicase HrpA [Victivallaceae bacterium]